MSQKTRAGNAIFFHHIYAGFIEQPIHLMLKISTLLSDPHFWGHCNLTGWLLHVLDASPVHILHVLYYRWAMMMKLNVLLLNLLSLWNSKHFFAVTVSWKSQWDLQITITYEIIVPWWDSMLRNVGTIPQIVLLYYLKMMNHSLL